MVQQFTVLDVCSMLSHSIIKYLHIFHVSHAIVQTFYTNYISQTAVLVETSSLCMPLQHLEMMNATWCITRLEAFKRNTVTMEG